MMRMLLDALLAAHVAGGAVSLVSFWVPAFSRKGGPLHRKAGRVYVKGMTLVVATAIPLSLASFARGNWVVGTFLLYLFAITGTALYTGTRALKSKAGPHEYITPLYKVCAWGTLLGGLAVLGLGLVTQTWLLAGFSFVGLLIGPGMLSFMRKPPTDPRYWWYEHFGGMIGTGIAAHIAFLNFGAQRLIPGFNLGDWGMLAWFVPVVAGLVATNRIEAHYRAKFGRSREKSGPQVIGASSGVVR
jgi:hypothetical protein